MKHAVIMSGISGSGKSTHAREYFPTFVHCSADNFFVSKQGVYEFNPALISKAHQQCFREFLVAVQCGVNVIVDNTNTETFEISPYVLLAESFGYQVEIQTIRCENETEARMCAARNKHGAPVEVVMQQYRNLQSRVLPPWWNNHSFPMTFDFARGY